MEGLEAKLSTIGKLESELAGLEAAIEREESAVAASASQLEAAQSQTGLARDEAHRAEASAAGSLLGETVFRLEGLTFEPGTTTLTADSKTLLDQLANRLRAEDVAYFLEIQAPPASTPGFALETARAQEVRRYLHVDRGLPLHAVGTVEGAGAQSAGRAPPEPRDEVLEVLPAEPEAGESRLAILVVRGHPKS